MKATRSCTLIGMVKQIYPSELQRNKANTSDTEAPFLDLRLSISNGFVSSKIYDKRDDFDFDIVNFPFLGRGSTDYLLLLQIFSLTDQGSPSVMQHIVSVESSSLLLHSHFT